MTIFSRGFRGKHRGDDGLPPGQYLTQGFPVLSAGPTPRIPLDRWEFAIDTETEQVYRWTWPELTALPYQTPTADIRCVTSWSKLGARWQGVSLDVLFGQVETAAQYALVYSYGGYTTNLPLEDLLDGKAWIAYRYDGQELAPKHGGPGTQSGLHVGSCRRGARGRVAVECEISP
ncbi:molybdopterin-dependent oxidoreductase [Nonomuraea angiospora]|uniref:molybdopterin-dependent oxidoreductase n=1 Tax=Nonomuraea angiospora TaxID=46172 RepID=UPI0034234A2B